MLAAVRKKNTVICPWFLLWIRYFRNNRIMEEKTAVIALAALAQEMRLRIFRALVVAGPQGLTPGALSAMLDVPASTLSFHLKELMHAGLALQERDGRSLIYRPALNAMNALLEYLTAHCCQGAGCEVDSLSGRTHC
jgi:DNA-binding transcriptional ArsR family regulator